MTSQSDSAELAGTFIENAAGFMHGAALAPSDFTEQRLHSASIAFELSTKSAILHAGGTDEQNRRELRHDLVRAIDAADAIGFEASPAARRFAARLSPYYSTHTLAALAIDTAEAGELVQAAEAHLAAVIAWMAAPAFQNRNPL